MPRHATLMLMLMLESGGGDWTAGRTEKEVVGVGTVSPNAKDLNHVEELAMYVPDHRDW